MIKNVDVIEKPWGKEELIEKNDKYVVKRLTMLKNHRCSLQYHELKKETIYVLSGKLKIYLGDKEDELEDMIFNPGEFITIAPYKIHRMEGVDEAIYLESSTPELDDVVRVQDDYKRV